MVKFDVKNFWRKKFDFNKIKKAKRYFQTIDKYFTDSQLKRGFDQSPYFYHPLSHWLFYSDQSPIYKKSLCLLETQLFTFEKYKASGFKERIKKLQSESSQESFYSFLSELGIAWHFLYYRRFNVEFFDYSNSAKKQIKKPDLKITDSSKEQNLFIEVYTHYKFYFRLKKLEELLIEIDPRLRIARDLFIKSEPTVLNECEINNIVNMILAKLKDKEIRDKINSEYQIVLLEKDNLQIYLENKENFKDGQNYKPALIKHGGGEPLDTYKAQLKEIFKDKASYSQLEKYHPNILAINSLFNEDFQLGIVLRLDQNPRLTGIEMPEFVDTFYLFTLGIESELTDFKKQGKLFWRENSDIQLIREMTSVL